MADNDHITPPGEAEELTAYLDGELPPAQRAALEKRLAADAGLAAHLEEMRSGGRDFRGAFERLFAEAPEARLRAILAEVQAKAGAAPVAPRRRWRFAAVAAVLFLVGGVIGVLIPRFVPALAPEPVWNWRATVAEYVSLYTNETFAGIPEDVAIQTAQLAAAGSKLGIALDPSKVSLPEMALKGALVFEYRDMPLAQIAYLSADGPVAVCILKNGRPDQPPRFEEREGLGIVYWTKGGRGYLIIGKKPRPELETLAASLEQRLT